MLKGLQNRNMMTGPPFDPFKIREVDHARIEFEYVPRHDIGTDGSLEPTTRGFLIKIAQSLADKGKRKYRLRSTATHELMHTFFYDTTTLPPSKLGQGDASRKHFLIEEELCHYLARAFLMPSFSVLELKSKDKSLGFPSIKSINRLKSIFEVSSEIVAYRMIIDLRIWDSIFMKLVQEGAFFRLRTRSEEQGESIIQKNDAAKVCL